MSDDVKPATGHIPGAFLEALAIMDDQTWIWALVQHVLARFPNTFIRLPSTVPVRTSWHRFRAAPVIIVHWEAPGRPGGALIEEIADIDPAFDIGHRVIVLTDNPVREDVVYFSELGVRRILRVRNRDKEINDTVTELTDHVKSALLPASSDAEQWLKILKAIDRLPVDAPETLLTNLDTRLLKLRRNAEPGARDLDAMASLAFARSNKQEAEKLWLRAIDLNPNYYRAYNKLAQYYRATGRPQESLAIMQKMNLLNKNNIARHVAMGEVSMELGDDKKAEAHFTTAVERDQGCSGALNGLAEIRFKQGDLDASRIYLEKSSLAYRMASKLNKMGITLVQTNRFSEALEHYSKAQYVLPQHEKGPQLFFNIGLCYARWGKFSTSQEFLKLALVKEPNYKKAEKLLEQVRQLQQKTGATKGAA